MKIPSQSNPLVVQKNNGVRDGNANVAGSFNIDITRRPGKIMPSPRLKQVLNVDSEATLTTINAFAYYASRYWAVGDDIFESGSNDPTTGWAEDTITSSPSLSTISADIVVFNDQLIVSDTTDLVKWASGDGSWDVDWYTAVCGGSALQFSKPHPMAVVQIGSPVLCIGDGNYMNTVIGTTATDPRLTLPVDQNIRWIVGGNSRAYIGTVNNAEDIGFSFVYEWDGGDTVPTRAYRLDARGALAGVMHNDTLYVVDSNGALLKLSGNSLIKVAQFPILNSRWQPVNYDTPTLAAGPIGHKGMCVVNDKILINIAGSADTASTPAVTFPEYSYSGVWEFDPYTGSLSHKHSYTSDSAGSVDYGQRAVPVATDEAPGAIFPARHPSASLLVSGSYYANNGSTEKSAIYVDDVNGGLDRRSRFYSNTVFSPDLANGWKVRLKYALMKNANDKLRVKYRVEDDLNLPFSAAVTWTDGDTFTSTNANFANVLAGHEIEVIMGDGGGQTVQVSSISEAAGTYTVNLNESVTGIAGSEAGYVRVHNFKLFATIADQTVGYKELHIPTRNSSWIQVEVEFIGDGDDSPILEELDIIPIKQQ